MNRRSFLSVLGLIAATAVLDPEKLLWLPGQKTIFVPPVVPPVGWQFLTVDMITQEALRVLKNNLIFHRYIDPSYDLSFRFGKPVRVALQSPHV